MTKIEECCIHARFFRISTPQQLPRIMASQMPVWKECASIVGLILILPFMMMMPIVFCAAPLVLLKTSYWWVAILLISWIYYDRNTGKRGGRRSEFLRRYFPLPILFRDYLDVRLIKTADLDPEKNYIFGYHPHGSTVGVLCTFLSTATGFDRLFPGLKPHFGVLWPFMVVPIMRELASALGEFLNGI